MYPRLHTEYGSSKMIFPDHPSYRPSVPTQNTVVRAGDFFPFQGRIISRRLSNTQSRKIREGPLKELQSDRYCSSTSVDTGMFERLNSEATNDRRSFYLASPSVNRMEFWSKQFVLTCSFSSREIQDSWLEISKDFHLSQILQKFSQEFIFPFPHPGT